MESKNLILIVAVVIWLMITAVVIWYPLITGQIKAGLDPVSRQAEPQRFWYAYAFSTILFLMVSIALGFFMRGILH